MSFSLSQEDAADALDISLSIGERALCIQTDFANHYELITLPQIHSTFFEMYNLQQQDPTANIDTIRNDAKDYYSDLKDGAVTGYKHLTDSYGVSCDNRLCGDVFQGYDFHLASDAGAVQTAHDILRSDERRRYSLVDVYREFASKMYHGSRLDPEHILKGHASASDTFLSLGTSSTPRRGFFERIMGVVQIAATVVSLTGS